VISAARIALALALCVASGWCARVRADSYEWQRTERLLSARNLAVDEAPEGKRIAWIEIVRDDVLVADEVWPTIFNWFHMTTRQEVVRRELLFDEQQPYDEARIEESMRNLRGMAIFALVRIVPIALDEPGAVGVLVHTRDLWSLRLETGFTITTIADQAVLRLVERNFLGRNQALAVEYTLLPKSYVFGQSYAARRLLGSAVYLKQTAAAQFMRSGGAEGSYWSLEVDKPFYNLKQRFSWATQASYENAVTRKLTRKEYRLYAPLFNPQALYARRVWRQRVAAASAAGYLRVGESFKHTWGVGWDVRQVSADPIAETRLPRELARRFRSAVLPRERLEIGPTLSYDVFRARFVAFENLVSFGQTENVRVGPTASLSMRAPLEAFGSDSDSVVLGSSAGLALAPRGSLLEARLSGSLRSTRYGLQDQRFQALVRGATKVLFDAFRVVGRVSLDARRNDTANTYVTLGASNGLRGYPSQEVAGYGASRLLANLELRTLAVEWQGLHLGAVVFYDVGSVYLRRREVELHHAAGIGLRLLIPQFNRTPFSFDLGTSYEPSFRLIPTITDQQVVALTPAEDAN
jgi:hypothetical protein